MSGSFGQLDLVLGQQLAGLTALKNWLPRKAELVDAGNLTELEALVVREDAQLRKLQQLDSDRRVLLGILARELGLGDSATLAELIRRAPAAEQGRLRLRLTALETLQREWQAARASAAPRIERALDHVHLTLDALAELSTAREAAYDAAPAARPGSVTMVVDRTA